VDPSGGRTHQDDGVRTKARRRDTRRSRLDRRLPAGPRCRGHDDVVAASQAVHDTALNQPLELGAGVSVDARRVARAHRLHRSPRQRRGEPGDSLCHVASSSLCRSYLIRIRIAYLSEQLPRQAPTELTTIQSALISTKDPNGSRRPPSAATLGARTTIGAAAVQPVPAAVSHAWLSVPV